MVSGYVSPYVRELLDCGLEDFLRRRDIDACKGPKREYYTLRLRPTMDFGVRIEFPGELEIRYEICVIAGPFGSIVGTYKVK